MNDWTPATPTQQPAYGDTVLLTVRRGSDVRGPRVVVTGYREKTAKRGDTYIITNWRNGETARVPAQGTSTGDGEYIVAAWQPFPFAYKPE